MLNRTITKDKENEEAPAIRKEKQYSSSKEKIAELYTKTVDIVEMQQGILLMHDKHNFAKDYYTLIQGYNMNKEDSQEAAIRILKEKTGLKTNGIEQLFAKKEEQKPEKLQEQLIILTAPKKRINYYLIKAEGELKIKQQPLILQAFNNTFILLDINLIRDSKTKGDYKGILYNYEEIRANYMPQMMSEIKLI